MTKIYSNDQIFQLAYNDGWVGLRGTKINVQGIDFSFCPLWKNDKLRIKISEVDTGALLFEIPIPRIISYIVNIREDLIEYYEAEIVPIIELLIDGNGIEKIREETEKVKKQMIRKFGDMPYISDLEGE
ncbi:hypothetical protein ACHWNZ_002879 [Listeria monocytogenes]|nr:hypothetical protein [Listeria monocytogenes]EDP7876480.1 hypothetical protein [Listeria monocytogenes]